MKKIVIMSDNHGDQSMIDYVKEHERLYNVFYKTLQSFFFIDAYH